MSAQRRLAVGRRRLPVAVSICAVPIGNDLVVCRTGQDGEQTHRRSWRQRVVHDAQPVVNGRTQILCRSRQRPVRFSVERGLDLADDLRGRDEPYSDRRVRYLVIGRTVVIEIKGIDESRVGRRLNGLWSVPHRVCVEGVDTKVRIEGHIDGDEGRHAVREPVLGLRVVDVAVGVDERRPTRALVIPHDLRCSRGRVQIARDLGAVSADVVDSGGKEKDLANILQSARHASPVWLRITGNLESLQSGACLRGKVVGCHARAARIRRLSIIRRPPRAAPPIGVPVAGRIDVRTRRPAKPSGDFGRERPHDGVVVRLLTVPHFGAVFQGLHDLTVGAPLCDGRRHVIRVQLLLGVVATLPLRQLRIRWERPDVEKGAIVVQFERGIEDQS